MQIELFLIIIVSLAVILICVITLVLKYIRTVQNHREFVQNMNTNIEEITILEQKLPEIRLKNTAPSIDDNINYIKEDKSLIFRMNWGEIIE